MNTGADKSKSNKVYINGSYVSASNGGFCFKMGMYYTGYKTRTSKSSYDEYDYTSSSNIWSYDRWVYYNGDRGDSIYESSLSEYADIDLKQTYTTYANRSNASQIGLVSSRTWISSRTNTCYHLTFDANQVILPIYGGTGTVVIEGYTIPGPVVIKYDCDAHECVDISGSFFNTVSSTPAVANNIYIKNIYFE